jgi:hypothetical protein
MDLSKTPRCFRTPRVAIPFLTLAATSNIVGTLMWRVSCQYSSVITAAIMRTKVSRGNVKSGYKVFVAWYTLQPILEALK